MEILTNLDHLMKRNEGPVSFEGTVKQFNKEQCLYFKTHLGHEINYCLSGTLGMV